MADRRSRRLPRLPRGAWLVVAVALVWIAFQNSILLLWFSSGHLEPMFVVARAIARVGMHLAADYWMIPAAVFLGVALALTGVPQGDESRTREVRRV